jgi:hypothetical protein
LRYDLEQAFILPLPKYSGPHLAETTMHDEMKQTGQVIIWQSVLDKLGDRRISWSELEAYLPLESEEVLLHPLVRQACDKKGNTLLHLAVLQERLDWVELLGKDASLKRRRNLFELTALELAQFLHKQASAAVLDSSIFQPNILIKEGREDFSYIHHPIFENKKILDDVLEQTSKAKLQDLIPPEKIWMGIYFDQEIQTGSNPRLSIRYINKEIGYGVFTEQKIPVCGYVGEYTGIVKERCKRLLKDKIYCVRYASWQTGRRQFILDAETHGNYTRFINHSSEPNLALHSVYWRGLPRMVFISLKEIPKGAQLSFDYGRSFWKEMNREPQCLL